ITQADLSRAQTDNGLLLLVLALTFALPAAIWGFAFGTGAPLTPYASGFNTSSSTPTPSFGLICANQAPSIQATVVLLILVPAITYIVGGRVADRIARSQRAEAAFISGALMALPLSVLMAASAALAAIGFDISAAGQGGSVGVSPSIGGTFLAVLVFGAVLGGLGGASLLLVPQLGALPRLLMLPFRPLTLLLNPLLDRLTGLPPGPARGRPREWPCPTR